MIEVFVAYPAETADVCDFIRYEVVEQIEDLILGSAEVDAWSAPEVEVLPPDSIGRLTGSDFVSTASTSYFLMHQEAASRLLRALPELGPALPVHASGGELRLIWNCELIPALDVAGCKGYKSLSGKFSNLDEFAFVPSEVGRKRVFRAQGYVISPVFFLGAGMKVLRDLGFTGLNFEKVWSTG